MPDCEDGPTVGIEPSQPPPSPLYSSLASFSSLLLSTSPTTYFSRRLAFYLGGGSARQLTKKSRHSSYTADTSHQTQSRKNSFVGDRVRKTSSASVTQLIDYGEGRYFDFDLPTPLSGKKKTFAAPVRKGSLLWKRTYRKQSLCEPIRKISASSPPSRKSSTVAINPPSRKNTIYYDSSSLGFEIESSSRKNSISSLTLPPSYSGLPTRKLSKIKIPHHHNHNHNHHHHKAQKVSVPASSVGEQKQRARLRLLSSGMEYAYGVIKKIHNFYNEINPASLTGAIDVIVVEQPDGSYQSTPFHVRFGKYGVLHSREKVIDITINGKEIELKMKLGENGEAFFVEETEENDEFPEHLATSPLPHQVIDTDKVIMEGIRTLKKQQKQQRDETRSRVEKKRNQHRSTSRSLSRSPSPMNGRRRITTMANAANNHQQHNTAEYMVTQQQRLAPAPLARFRRIRSMPNLEHVECSAGRRVQHSYSTVEKAVTSSSANQKSPEDSDSEGSQPVASSDNYRDLRDSNTVMDGAVSDSEVDRCQLQLPTVGVDVKDWKWGELPDVDKTPTEEKSKPASSNKQSAETSSSGWTWFGWTRSSKRKEDQGIYLEDLEKSLEIDPSVTAKYLGRTPTSARASPPQLPSEATQAEDDQTPTAEMPPMSPPHHVPDDPTQELPDPDSPQDPGYSSNPGSVFGESSNGRSSSPWPYDVQGCLEDCAFSLCGANGAVDISTITEDQFNERRVSFEQFCHDPLLTAERQDLIMRINGRYYPRSVADAMLMSLIYFQKPLSEEKVNKLMDDYKQKMGHAPTKSTNPAGGGWFSWSRKGSSTEPEAKDETSVHTATPENASVDQKGTLEAQRATTSPMNIQRPSSRPSPSKSTTPPPLPVVIDMNGSGSEETISRAQRYVRSLRLPSEKLKALGLKKGMNEVRFSVTTKFQGTSWCQCHIYLWDWCDKIVISDIDGTITKSDVLGHLMPVIGGTWAHNDVAELYTGIKNNGYKLVYLSSRSIGQSSYTKHYLRTVVQNSNKMLPDGPMLLSPTSLLSAFRKEVIERKPYEFKIAALTDLKNLFPVKQPLYAGFGNRETDVKSYKAVNIAPERILTIDPNGIVRRADSIGYVSSYKGMAVDVVDYLFPPVIKTSKEEKSEQHAVVQFTKPQRYSSFTHWRRAPGTQPSIQDDDLKEYEARRLRSPSRPKK